MKGLSDIYTDDLFDIRVCEINNEVIIKHNGIEKKLNVGLWYPRGVDFFDHEIYITDSYNFMVKVFDINGNLLREFGHDILREPFGITVTNDKVFVVDKDNGVVRVFDKNGKYLDTFEKKMKYPTLIEFDGENFYVSNTNDGTIEMFDMNGKNILTVKNKMKYPAGICIFNNKIFVADEFNKRVVVFLKNGDVLGEIKVDEYVSIIKNIEEKLMAYNEKTGEFFEIDPSNIEVFNKELTEDINEEYEISEDMPEKIINKISDDYLDRPRGIAFEGNDIWTALFNKKIIVSISDMSTIKNYFSSDTVVDKLAVTDKDILFLDYFYRRIFIMDKISGDADKQIGENILESPIDFKLRDNRITVLDSVLKKIFVFNLSGKLLKSFSIKGEEPVSFDFDAENYYVLDKRTSKIYIYNNEMIKNEIMVHGAKYPECVCITESKEMYIADEGNGRVLKIDINGKPLIQITGLSMPKDVVCRDGKVYITDFGNNSIKTYKAR